MAPNGRFCVGIFLLRTTTEILRENLDVFNIGQNNSHFTLRPKNVHNNILVTSSVNERITLKSSHLRNIFRQSQEGRNTIWRKKLYLHAGPRRQKYNLEILHRIAHI